MQRPLLSLAIIVKNEAHNLHQLLGDIYDLFDEIVACDTGSTDNTVTILDMYGAHVVTRLWDDDFAAARNAAVEKCTSRWIIWLDADDRVSREDMEGLRAILSVSDPAESVFMRLENLSCDEGDIGVCNQLRVFPNIGAYFEGELHEQVVGTLKTLLGDEAKHHLLSYPIIVRHTGYMSREAMQRKWRRNLAMILARLVNGPNPPEISTVYHASQTLEGAGFSALAFPFYLWLLCNESDDEVCRFLIARAGTSAANISMDYFQFWFNRGVQIIEENMRRFPEDDLTHLILAQTRLRQGRFDDAYQIADAALKRGLKTQILPYSVSKATQALTEVRRIAGGQLATNRGGAA